MARPRRVEVWSDFQCDGGVRLAVFRGPLSGARTRRTSGIPELTLRYPAAASAHTQVRERRVIRLDYSDAVAEEWLILGIGELHSDFTVDLQCAGYGAKLGNVIVSRSDADGSQMFDFEAPSLTPTQQLSNFILAPATAAGMAVALGTVDPTAPCDMRYGFGQDSGWDTSLSAIQRLAQVVRNPFGGPCELDFRRNGATNYLVDVLHQVGASASTFHVRFRRNLPAGWRRSRATDRQATRVYARGAEVDGVAPTIARARWKVTAISGSDVTLADPAGGDGPIGFDDQLNGCYLRKVDGSLVQVTDSVASTQKVTLASVTGIAVNQIVEFRRTSAGDWLTFLEHPASKAIYGLIGRTLQRQDIPGTVNLGDNPVGREYSGGSSTLPDRWSKVGNPTITKNTSDFTRIRYGPASFRMQGTTDGDGADTPYSPIAPSLSEPIFPGFMGFWLEAGQVRIELIAAKDEIAVSSITRSGTTVTVTTGTAHGLAKGNRVEILGADQGEYNGIRYVTAVPSSTTFTYEVTGSPTTPATGTITMAWVRRIPEGTEGHAATNATKRWMELGVNDQATNLYALGATRVKFRIAQDGATACDVWVNYYQLTQSPTQLPFVEGAGPTKLWQEANRYLKANSTPHTSYEGRALNLRELDPVTWPWGTAAPTLGGPIKVTDETFGVVDTRILGLQDDPFSPVVTQLILSDDPGDLLDAIVGDRRPKALPKSVVLDTTPEVNWSLHRRPNTPGSIEVRLSTNPSWATAYYWIGPDTDERPSASLVQAGAPSDTAWGTYTQPFSVNQVQASDLRVWVYCVAGNNRSKERWFRIDKDTLPQITSLLLQETPALTVQSSWAPDDDVRSVRLYSQVGDWPVTALTISSLTRTGSVARAVTASAHHLKSGDLVKVSGANASAYNIEATVTVIDDYTFDYTISGTPTTPDAGAPVCKSARNPIDSAKFDVELAVDPNGGGYLANGTPQSGGTTFAKSGYANGNAVYVIAVPVDWRGLVGPPEYRGVGKITIANAATPTVFGVSASRTSSGSACDTTDGVEYSFTFSETDLVNGTHKFRAFATRTPGDETYSAMDTTPSGGGTVSFRVPYKVTSGKWDPSVTFNLGWELLDGSDAVIQSGTPAFHSDSFQSNCAL